MERIEKEIMVNNVHGLHARPAALFVQMANQFDSSIMLEKDGESVDGKSIIAILSLGINKGAVVKMTVEGHDAPEAFGKLEEFLQESND
ncbi:MAG: HPr family phosphocarrier protein [Candidatus Omnitrophota bacterium]|nr:MAG: HPr family phosphocarrier protein [Candidatus Omnitrophota bacterium]